MIDSLKTHAIVLFVWAKANWLTILIASGLSILGGLLFATLVISSLPSDYFLPKKRTSRIKQPVLRILLKVVKNLLALVFIIIGVLQLFLPGPGLLMLLIGIVISDIPGKRRLERKIIQSPPVLIAANNIRARFKRPVLRLDETKNNVYQHPE